MNSIRIKSFFEKQDMLKSFDPDSETWVVSDLQSKWEIQGQLLDGKAVLEEQAVLRASEFWIKLLQRSQPEWTLVSRELFDQWIWNWIKKNPFGWLKANESASLIHQHLELFAPLFIEDRDSHLIYEWFENNPDSVIKWRHLFEICQKIWLDMNNEKILSPTMVPPLLLQSLKDSDRLSELWNRKVYLDLGPRPKGVEKNLAQLLGRSLAVDWLECEVPSFEMNGSLRRLPTQLGESKEAVAEIRKILDRGVSPSEIAVFAPDIENFWPSLRYFLTVEGVPCNKPVVQKLIEDPLIQKWLSHLRIQNQKFSNKDLEVFFFQKAESPRLTFDDFRYYYETLNKPEDLGRWEGWSPLSSIHSREVQLTEFMEWAIGYWAKAYPIESLEKIWKVLSKDFDPKLKMSLSHWIFYLESKLSKSETVVEEAHPHGIHLLSLYSAEWCGARHVLFLGMNESELSVRTSLLVSRFECEKIKQDLGFELDYPVESVQELYLAWISQKEFVDKYYFTSGITFTGEEISPSRHWLKSAYKKDPNQVKKVSSPALTRFDEIARSMRPENESFEKVPFERVSLSASSVRSFSDCPFIYFAAKGLRLVDQPVLDFDLDPMTKGSLLHAVLEEVVKNFDLYKENSAAVGELIEKVKEELKVSVGEMKIWPAMKKELLRLTGNFIQMEKELRAERPNLKTLGFEIGFAFYFDLQTEEAFALSPSFQEDPRKIKVTGRIDRVDGGGEGELSIVDYKLSSGRIKTWSKWPEEGDLQMPLYSWALEKGFADFTMDLKSGSPEVVAAYYWVPKTKERTKGYFLKDSSSAPFIPPSNRSWSWITRDKKDELLKSSVSVLKDVGLKIQRGEMEPQPKEMSLCETCRWRALCRAPHLI